MLDVDECLLSIAFEDQLLDIGARHPHALGPFEQGRQRIRPAFEKAEEGKDGELALVVEDLSKVLDPAAGGERASERRRAAARVAQDAKNGMFRHLPVLVRRPPA